MVVEESSQKAGRGGGGGREGGRGRECIQIRGRRKGHCLVGWFHAEEKSEEIRRRRRKKRKKHSSNSLKRHFLRGLKGAALPDFLLAQVEDPSQGILIKLGSLKKKRKAALIGDKSFCDQKIGVAVLQFSSTRPESGPTPCGNTARGGNKPGLHLGERGRGKEALSERRSNFSSSNTSLLRSSGPVQ